VLTEVDSYYTHIAKFFADGKWLMFNVDNVLEPIIEAGNAMMSNGIVIALLKHENYFVWVNTNIKTAEDCTGSTSQTWIVDQCYALIESADESCTPQTEIACSGITYITDDRWNKLIDENGSYKLNAEDFYTTAYDCKRSFPDGDGDIDVGALPYDGTIPKCFYNINVRKGEWIGTHIADVGL
jgi:hypothetical protein